MPYWSFKIPSYALLLNLFFFKLGSVVLILLWIGTVCGLYVYSSKSFCYNVTAFSTNLFRQEVLFGDLIKELIVHAGMSMFVCAWC